MYSGPGRQHWQQIVDPVDSSADVNISECWQVQRHHSWYVLWSNHWWQSGPVDTQSDTRWGRVPLQQEDHGPDTFVQGWAQVRGKKYFNFFCYKNISLGVRQLLGRWHPTSICPWSCWSRWWNGLELWMNWTMPRSWWIGSRKMRKIYPPKSCTVSWKTVKPFKNLQELLHPLSLKMKNVLTMDNLTILVFHQW